jgi:hypothetical protein
MREDLSEYERFAKPAPEDPEEARLQRRARRIDQYVEEHQRSPSVAFLLTFLFGPIGYLYASLLGGVIFTLVSLFLLAFWPALVLLWLVLLISAPFTAKGYNKKLRSKAELLAGD